MNFKKSWPIVVTLVFISIIVYLFTNIRQTEVICLKTSTFDDVVLKENVVTILDGKKIKSMLVTKTILLPEKYANESSMETIEEALDRTLEYLGKKVNYVFNTDKVTVKIEVHKDEVILLDNISFTTKNDLRVFVDSNTKSNAVITLTIGDNYTDGEFMKYMKSKGYNCK